MPAGKQFIYLLKSGRAASTITAGILLFSLWRILKNGLVKNVISLAFKWTADINLQTVGKKRKPYIRGAPPADIISHIYNWEVLRSGLFSKWRYFTHWANASLEEEDIDWFILVLHQLYKSFASKNL